MATHLNVTILTHTTVNPFLHAESFMCHIMYRSGTVKSVLFKRLLKLFKNEKDSSFKRGEKGNPLFSKYY